MFCGNIFFLDGGRPAYGAQGTYKRITEVMKLSIFPIFLFHLLSNGGGGGVILRPGEAVMGKETAELADTKHDLLRFHLGCAGCGDVAMWLFGGSAGCRLSGTGGLGDRTANGMEVRTETVTG